MAAQRGHIDAVKMFLDYHLYFQHKINHPWDSIEVDKRKNHKKGLGVTAAFLAAKHGHLEIFKLLYEKGAQIEGIVCNIGGKQCFEPIHIAAKNGHFPIIQFILSKSENRLGCVQVIEEHSGSMPIHLAAYGGHINIVQMLLEFGAPLMATNRFQDTFMHIAIRHNQKSFMFEMLPYIENNSEQIFVDMPSGNMYYDVENSQENLTPYGLALLRE